MADSLPRVAAVHSKFDEFTLLLPLRLKQYSYVREALEILKVQHEYIDPDQLVEVIELLLPTQTSPTGNPSAYALEKLQALFRDKLMSSISRPFRKIYISRKKAPKRRVLNEDEIVPILQDAGFEIHVMEDYPLAEQIRLFSESKIVAGLHGAGFVNSMFMHAGTTLLEVRNNKDDYNNCFFSMASALPLNYYLLGAEASYADGHVADCKVAPNELAEMLGELL
jgi:capsular polysaccharide biosynthesis protein